MRSKPSNHFVCHSMPLSFLIGFLSSTLCLTPVYAKSGDVSSSTTARKHIHTINTLYVYEYVDHKEGGHVYQAIADVYSNSETSKCNDVLCSNVHIARAAGVAQDINRLDRLGEVGGEFMSLGANGSRLSGKSQLELLVRASNRAPSVDRSSFRLIDASQKKYYGSGDTWLWVLLGVGVIVAATLVFMFTYPMD